MRHAVGVLGALVVLAGPAEAQDFTGFDLTAADVKRLQERPQTMLAALEQAQAGAKADLATLRGLMTARPMPIGDARQLAGDWRCRVIKVGGLLPLTPYGFFNCRITGRGDRARLEKTSGSQRTAGDLLRLDGASYLYRGTGFTDYEPLRPYGSRPENDEVGLLFRIGANRLRLELPAPHHESTYNVMEFVRKK